MPKGAPVVPRWLFGLLLIPLWVVAVVGMVTGKWWTFSPGYSVSTGYEDLRWIARWAECVAAGDYEDLVRDCQVAYPLLSVWIAARLGFTQNELVVVGVVMAVAWVLAASSLVLAVGRRAGFAWAAVVAASLSSPATWLLLERGNLDIVVWILTLLALAALVRRKDVGASILIAISTLLKIFPIGLSLGLLLDARRNLRRAALLIVAPAICAIAVVATGRYVSSLRPNPVGDAFASFHGPYLGRVVVSKLQGADVQPASITTQVIPSLLDYVLGVAAFVLAAGVIWFLLFRRMRVDPDARAFSWFTSALGLILFAYLTGANFDYRLTFLSFVIAGVAIAYPQLQSGLAKGCAAAAAVGLAMATWLGVGSPLAVQLVGDGVLWLSLVTVSGLATQVFLVTWRSPAGHDDIGPAS